MLKNFPNRQLSYSLILLILFSTIVFPQSQRANYKILGITVEGNKTADANTVIANCGLKTGDELEIPGDQTNNAIKRLWALGIFSDIQIDIAKKINDGVFLLIKVKEYPRLEQTVIQGNDDISESDIEKNIGLVRGQILKPQDVTRIKDKIQKQYFDEGFVNAKITPEYTFVSADSSKDEVDVTWHEENDFSKEYTNKYDTDKLYSLNSIDRIKARTLLIFNIDEGSKAVVREINFIGNKAYDDSGAALLLKEINLKRIKRSWPTFIIKTVTGILKFLAIR